MTGPPGSEQGCIASLRLQLQPHASARLQARCRQLPGWEILDASRPDELIVLAEADTRHGLLAAIDRLLEDPDLIQISPFYQESFGN